MSNDFREGALTKSNDATPAEPSIDKSVNEGPFGNPDAARANVKNPDVLVDMGAVAPHLLVKSDDFAARLIVGRKGSGKTFHLRNMRISAEARQESIVFEDTNPLPEWVLRQISSALEEKRAYLGWQVVWRRAIFLFLVSMIYCKTRVRTQKWSSSLEPILKREVLFREFSSICDPTITEVTPVQFLTKFANRYANKRGEFMRFLQHHRWVELENLIASSLHNSPAIYVFVDALDNEAEYLPRLWCDSQLGLFYLIFEFLGQGGYGNKLHVMTTIRDSVYRNVLRGEHAPRFFLDEHMKMLSWGVHETQYFLQKKISQLSRSQFEDVETVDRSLAVWLGFDRVENPKRGIEEPLLQYILRHTRALPRDIIMLGNRIASEKAKCVSLGKTFKDGHLRKSVEDVARMLARESISVCASEMIINEEANAEYGRVLKMDYHEIDGYRKSVEGMIRSLINLIGIEIFTSEQLKSAINLVYKHKIEAFSEGNQFNYDRVDHVLWRNGLIAYLDERGNGRSRWIYGWYSDTERGYLPEGAVMYGFHPCLIDLCGIKNGGKNVVF